MQDAAIYYSSLSKKPPFSLPEKFLISTIHRPENTKYPKRLNSIFSALEQINTELPVVLPLHPGTKKMLEQNNFDLSKSKIQFVEPVGYLQMVYLLQKCSMVITDSGGLQKETFFFKKPGLTLRDESEWVELTKHGLNMICGADKNLILKSFKEMNNKELNYDINLYGNGLAAEKIIKVLRKF